MRLPLRFASSLTDQSSQHLKTSTYASHSLLQAPVLPPFSAQLFLMSTTASQHSEKVRALCPSRSCLPIFSWAVQKSCNNQWSDVTCAVQTIFCRDCLSRLFFLLLLFQLQGSVWFCVLCLLSTYSNMLWGRERDWSRHLFVLRFMCWARTKISVFRKVCWWHKAGCWSDQNSSKQYF